MARKRAAGVDLVLLRDTHAYYYETQNGHVAETLEEWNYGRAADGFHTWAQPEEEAMAVPVGAWRAVPQTRWCCDGYRLRDATGRLRGHVQLRYGIVRAVAGQPADAERVDPLVAPDEADRWRRRTCRGQIVLQEHYGRAMAGRFDASDRAAWLVRAVAAVEATPAGSCVAARDARRVGHARAEDVSGEPAGARMIAAGGGVAQTMVGMVDDVMADEPLSLEDELLLLDLVRGAAPVAATARVLGE